ncbi:MAG: DUF4347 domain-containing protein [Desulfobacteraceae bacterium]|nr:DUF4347 domain-containing protein [Desulfobacteraceae bacterium]
MMTIIIWLCGWVPHVKATPHTQVDTSASYGEPAELSPLIDSTAPQRLELVFIDAGIDDHQALVDTYKSMIPDCINIQVIVLDTQQDGILQISSTLAQYSGVSALHILSHAKEGRLNIGASQLDFETLTLGTTAHLFKTWQSALTSQADILLYGCNLAEGRAGIEFVRHFGQLTGADVAASDNTTGNATKNGDWNLEISTGEIETAVLAVEGYQGTLGFVTTDYNGDAVADPLRMITWNVIGVDSNKPASQGPDTFMVRVRVEADSSGLNNLVVRIVDDDDKGLDIFGGGFVMGDAAGDFNDGSDDIKFINRLEYTGESIGANSYKDYYFNVQVNRSKDSHDQIQPFHFEVFENGGDLTWDATDSNGDGINDTPASEDGRALTKFSWLQDAAASNTPLYLYVEKYISQARNDISDQTYPTMVDVESNYPAIRVETADGSHDYVNDGSKEYNPPSPITIFVGDTLHIRSEGQTATQGYPQLTLSTVFNNQIFSIVKTEQFYNKYITNTDYQQGLGTGQAGTFNPDPFQVAGSANSSIYANPAGWNPSTHGLMVTSAPPKAGGGPITTDYEVTVNDSGSGRLDTLILDYSGSSFHYNADLDSGTEGIEYIRFNVVYGAIVGNVSAGAGLSGITVTLYNDNDSSGDYSGGDTQVGSAVTTDANGDYVFTNLLPGEYVVVEQSPITNYSDVSDTDGAANGLSTSSYILYHFE